MAWGAITGFHGKLREEGAEKISFESQSTKPASLCAEGGDWGGVEVSKPLHPILEELLGLLGGQSHKQMTAEVAAKIEACPQGAQSRE